MAENNMDDLQLQFDMDLLKKRTIFLRHEVNGPKANKIGQAILWLNARDPDKPINLYINSVGGSIIAGFDICDIIRHSRAQVIGLVYRQANSMASVILQACAKRKAMRNSTLYLHNIRLVVEGEFHEIDEKVKKAVAETKDDQEKIYQYLAEKTKISLNEIAEICRKRTTLSAEKALELGLIDEII